ncbi:translation elongation factor 1B gamma subunit [Strongylocentrotus purpuratus]|uniref:Elongation factor 1-gamma n=1 Tax=Strongylocentrotus purpuratus TaxID=7668 RepID=Q4VY61_STRPU|nr:eukaryotic translation elongation factor 1 gamma [Strongylocentrotus purpuratus]CAJ00307.1 translation elongation factor 1B gamma subunit [Strongylocentrotus purpuratus]|eukprot:NP_001020382.1 translation elongation factor 1B gamma subunit [Strongylocentrotus purpuratus]
MASGTLYTYPENTRAYKIQIAAGYSGAQLTVVQDPPAFKFGETNKSAEFLKKFPLGKVPAFENGSGDTLFESNAIAYYVSNEQLRGTDDLSKAQVQMFVNLADNEIEPAASTWVFPTLGVVQYNKQQTEKAKETLKAVLGFLNEYLKTRTFLVGERVTLADISVGCQLLGAYKQVLDVNFRKEFVHLNRWFVTLVNQPEVKAIVGEVTLCEKMAQFDSKKYAELSGGSKKEKKPKVEKPKAEKKAKKEVVDDEDDEPPPPPKPKVDLFADCPKSDFDMDAWKRCYSNKDTETEALPYFWDKFDKEGYSIWHCEYNIPEYLKENMVYQTCNLVAGFFQRTEKMVKNAFGNVLIFGEDKDTALQGVFFWKGQSLIFERCEDWQVDYQSYNWTKLDPETAETKRMVKKFFMWEGDFGPLKVNQGKTYK